MASNPRPRWWSRGWASEQRGRPHAPVVFSYLSLGEYEEAFAWLERAYQEQSNILQYLKVDPFFDPVRGDPRFADLLRCVDLDHAH